MFKNITHIMYVIILSLYKDIEWFMIYIKGETLTPLSAHFGLNKVY